jgi:hypothetical protein
MCAELLGERIGPNLKGEASADLQVADELYPDTIDSSTATSTGDLSIEEELQAELKQMQGGSTGKSKRFRLCQHDIQCGQSAFLSSILNSVRTARLSFHS